MTIKQTKVNSRLEEVSSQLAESMDDKIKNDWFNTGSLKFCAHRGLQKNCPENTLKAIRNAGINKFDIVEIDPKKTIDGQWVLMHDDTVNRTTNGTGNVEELKYSYIANLLIKNDIYMDSNDEKLRVPTLESAIECIASFGMGANLDANKYDFDKNIIDYFVNLLIKNGIEKKSIIAINHHEGRKYISDNYPNIKIGWVSTSSAEQDIEEFKLYKNGLVCYSMNNINSDKIDKCNKAGLPILLSGVNSYNDLTKFKSNIIKIIETDILDIGRYN